MTRALIVSLTSEFPLLMVFGFFTSGIFSWGAFNWLLDLTNTETFCVSCHEMRDNLYPEYRKSVHFLNKSGVRATCPDCHVPRNWIDKVIRKVGATNELIHKALGSIDTREKFLNKRLILAGYVWSAMAANNSLECRNCHELTAMSEPGQTPNKAHRRAHKSKMTCIDCHKGIAHELPIGFIEREHARFDLEKTDCGNCHVSLHLDNWGENETWER